MRRKRKIAYYLSINGYMWAYQLKKWIPVEELVHVNSTATSCRCFLTFKRLKKEIRRIPDTIQTRITFTKHVYRKGVKWGFTWTSK